MKHVTSRHKSGFDPESVIPVVLMRSDSSGLLSKQELTQALGIMAGTSGVILPCYDSGIIEGTNRKSYFAQQV